jgi:biopolymer transport protein ExbB/TolQ
MDPNFFVIIKGPEQELAIIFAIWALAIMGYKFRNVGIERRLFDTDLVSVAEGDEDARAHSRAIESLPVDRRDRLLPRLYQNALNRFRITRSVQDASEEARRVAESVNDRLDAELAVIRYICWAIPSIGFVGTVRGIGDSLGHAQAVLQGDMTGVTEALGVAFNATLVALLLSLFTVFLLYQLQLAQERLVLDAHQDCERKLIQNLQGPPH